MKSARRMLEQPSLLDAMSDVLPDNRMATPADARPAIPGVRSRSERRAKARVMQAAGARRWIDTGKPIALEVAKRDGSVTAETFRTAAADLRKLPPTYGQQRAYSWLPAMFAELVRERRLKKQTRPDGSVVKTYSKEQGNDQVVYVLAGGAHG